MRRATVALLGLVAVVAGCGGGGGTKHAATTTTPTPTAASPCRGAQPPHRYDHVVIVAMENHNYSEIDGHSPYLNGLAADCALANDYDALTHPSLPNYIAMTSGDKHGILTDCTDCSVSAPSIFGQLAGDWRSYLESIPSAGYQGSESGSYVKRHNPAAYYTPLAAEYAKRAVPLNRLSADLAHGTLSRFSLVIPNLCNDEHDCSVATGDDWLRIWIPRLLASPAYKSGKTAVIVTYDEGTLFDNKVYTVVAARSVRPGTVVGDSFDHYSLLLTTEQLLGLPCLGDACHARSMAVPFRLSP
jgi:phospholipase C